MQLSSMPGYDRWCEQRMWLSMGVDSQGTEPVCTLTGLAFIVIPWMHRPAESPRLLKLFHMAMFMLGLGTLVFHMVPNLRLTSNVDVDAFDWNPITLVCIMLLYIYLEHWAGNGALFYCFALALFGWAGFLTWTRGYLSGTVLNILLVMPLLACLAVHSVYLRKTEARAAVQHVWTMLLISLVLWATNVLACPRFHALAVLHAIYHFTITAGLWSAACLGVELKKHLK